MQLDLFDNTDYETKDQEQKAWKALMIPADWVAPYDCADGTPKGTVRTDGWQCPSCGVVEPNDFVLTINHGIDPHRPGRKDFLTRCLSMQHRENQARHRDPERDA